MPLDEQVAVLEQLADLPLDPLLAAGGAPGGLVERGAGPAAASGRVAASRLRILATAERTALVTSRRTWNVQS